MRVKEAVYSSSRSRGGSAPDLDTAPDQVRRGLKGHCKTLVGAEEDQHRLR